MNKIFYTDGSSKGNPGPGGWGALELNISTSQTMGEYIDRYTLIQYHNEQCSDTTNNREELKAILYVAQLAAEDPDNEYIIYTDSLYCVNTINNWMYTWAKNDWLNSKKKPAENLDLIQPLWKLFSTPFFNAQVKKVQGHSNIIGNELADCLATNKMTKFEQIIKDNHIYNAQANNVIIKEWNF